MIGRLVARSLAALAVSAVGGCASTLEPSAFDDGATAMRPEAFFAGTTRSTGVLESQAGAPTRRLRVEGRGIVLPNGLLRLDQTVLLEADAPQPRTWLLRRVDEHRYVATLTDAAGDVEGEAFGDLFHLRYAMKRPFGSTMEQWLYLQPDGRTVVNEATIRLFGIVVARLSERITRDDGPLPRPVPGPAAPALAPGAAAPNGSSPHPSPSLPSASLPSLPPAS